MRQQLPVGAASILAASSHVFARDAAEGKASMSRAIETAQAGVEGGALEAELETEEAQD